MIIIYLILDFKQNIINKMESGFKQAVMKSMESERAGIAVVMILFGIIGITVGILHL